MVHDTNLKAFKTDLHNVDWNSINDCPKRNLKYETFLKYYLSYTKNTFP